MSTTTTKTDQKCATLELTFVRSMLEMALVWFNINVQAGFDSSLGYKGGTLNRRTVQGMHGSLSADYDVAYCWWQTALHQLGWCQVKETTNFSNRVTPLSTTLEVSRRHRRRCRCRRANSITVLSTFFHQKTFVRRRIALKLTNFFFVSIKTNKKGRTKI